MRLFVVALVACAHAVAPLRGEVQVGWHACAITRTPDGADVDDGGVRAWALVGDARVDVGRYPGVCDWASGDLPTIVCHDPHVDLRWVLRWTKAGDALLLERLEYEVSSEDGVPDPTEPRERRVLRRFALAPGATVTPRDRARRALPCAPDGE